MKKRPMRRIGVKDKPISKNRHNNRHNFLKYWRVVKYHVKRKYGISDPDVDILLYLYDEDYFTKKQFDEISALMKWESLRFFRLKRDGFIVVFRAAGETKDRRILYDLSQKSKMIVSGIYKKLLGEEEISMDPSYTPIMRGDTFMDKMYRQAIKRMNEKH